MILTELIKEQVFQCAVMAGAGLLVLILYQIFRGLCRILSVGHIIQIIAEIIFWTGAAAITSQFLYYCSYGRLSFHAAVAFGAGVLLWKKFFYDIIDRMFKRIQTKQGIYNKNGEKEKEQPIQGHQSGDRY